MNTKFNSDFVGTNFIHFTSVFVIEQLYSFEQNLMKMFADSNKLGFRKEKEDQKTFPNPLYPDSNFEDYLLSERPV